jgi:hypothetical protein
MARVRLGSTWFELANTKNGTPIYEPTEAPPIDPQLSPSDISDAQLSPSGRPTYSFRDLSGGAGQIETPLRAENRKYDRIGDAAAEFSEAVGRRGAEGGMDWHSCGARLGSSVARARAPHQRQGQHPWMAAVESTPVTLEALPHDASPLHLPAPPHGRSSRIRPTASRSSRQ